MLEKVFYKTYLLKFLLLDRILSGEEYLLLAEEVAANFQVNLNTAKKVLQELKEEGYIKTKKRVGSKVLPEIYERKFAGFQQLKEEVEALWNKYNLQGFLDEEILASVVSLLRDKRSAQEKAILFVDRNSDELWLGKMELEEHLGKKVKALLLKDALNFLKHQDKDKSLIITTYYCLPQLQKQNIDSFPLKVTPRIEEILDFSLFSRDARIVIICFSEQRKLRLKSRYKELAQSYKNLTFISPEEILESKNCLKADLICCPKVIFNKFKHVFIHMQNLYLYSRFYDQEGLSLLKKMV